MVVIRLARGGRKAAPVYRINVANKRDALGGRYIEKIGVYKPSDSKPEFDVNKERYDYWLSKGAQPTDRVKLLMATLAAGKTPRQPKPKAKKVEAAPAVEAAPEAETAPAAE
ncbi:30S ribosomal protein S16 [bacterium]|nr:30S ribosomal protein S16 [bacterium]